MQANMQAATADEFRSSPTELAPGDFISQFYFCGRTVFLYGSRTGISGCAVLALRAGASTYFRERAKVGKDLPREEPWRVFAPFLFARKEGPGPA